MEILLTLFVFCGIQACLKDPRELPEISSHCVENLQIWTEVSRSRGHTVNQARVF